MTTNEPAPGARTRLLLEPFVLTSSAENYGGGYRLVVRGRTLLQSEKDQLRVHEVLTEFKENSDPADQPLLYFVCGRVGMIARAMPLDRDWAGRRASYVTALAFSLDELAQTSTRSIWGLDVTQLSFLTHEQAMDLARQQGQTQDGKSVPIGFHADVKSSLLREGDMEWYRRNQELVLVALDVRAAGKEIGIECQDEPHRLLRWLDALTPPKDRLYRTFALNIVSTPKLPCETVAGRHTPASGIGASGFPRQILKLPIPPLSPWAIEVCGTIELLTAKGVDPERGLAEFCSRMPVQAKSLLHFWEMYGQHVRYEGMEDRTDLEQITPSAYAGALAFWRQYYPGVWGGVLNDYANAWLSIPDWLDRVLQSPILSADARGGIQAALQAGMRQLANEQSIAFLAGEFGGKASLSGMALEEAIQLLHNRAHGLDVEDVRAIDAIPDAGRRQKWVKKMHSALRDRCRRGQPPVESDAFLAFERIYAPTPKEKYAWLEAWPERDEDGLRRWITALVPHAAALNTGELSKLIQYVISIPEMASHVSPLMKTMLAMADARSDQSLLSAVACYRRFVNRSEESILKDLLIHCRQGSPAATILQKRLKQVRQHQARITQAQNSVQWHQPRTNWRVWALWISTYSFLLMALVGGILWRYGHFGRARSTPPGLPADPAISTGTEDPTVDQVEHEPEPPASEPPESQKDKEESELLDSSAVPPAKTPEPEKGPEVKDKPQAGKPYRIVTVKAGDTLSGIAKRGGISMAELQRLNRISDPNQIKAGDHIRIPSTPTRQPEAAKDRPIRDAPELSAVGEVRPDAAPAPSGEIETPPQAEEALQQEQRRMSKEAEMSSQAPNPLDSDANMSIGDEL